MSKDNIFIPLSVEQTTSKQSGYFFSTGKGVLIAVGFIPAAMWIPYISSKTMGSFSGIILGILSYALMYIFYLRFIIFEEMTWKRIFKNLETYKISGVDYFWGIDRIEKSGIIHYKYGGHGGIRKGIIIKIIPGTLVGKAEDYEEKYKEVVRNSLSYIMREEVYIDVHMVLEDKKIPKNIQSMYSKIHNIEDEVAREIAIEHVNNLALMTKNSKRLESIYVVAYFKNPTKFKYISQIANQIIGDLKGSGYFKYCTLLNDKEVEKYIAKNLLIPVLPKNLDYQEVNDFSLYGQIYRVFDEYGNEEWYEDGINILDEDIKQVITTKDEETEPKTLEDVHNDLFREPEESEVVNTEKIKDNIDLFDIIEDKTEDLEKYKEQKKKEIYDKLIKGREETDENKTIQQNNQSMISREEKMKEIQDLLNR